MSKKFSGLDLSETLTEIEELIEIADDQCLYSATLILDDLATELALMKELADSGPDSAILGIVGSDTFYLAQLSKNDYSINTFYKTDLIDEEGKRAIRPIGNFNIPKTYIGDLLARLRLLRYEELYEEVR